MIRVYKMSEELDEALMGEMVKVKREPDDNFPSSSMPGGGEMTEVKTELGNTPTSTSLLVGVEAENNSRDIVFETIRIKMEVDDSSRTETPCMFVRNISDHMTEDQGVEINEGETIPGDIETLRDSYQGYQEKTINQNKESNRRQQRSKTSNYMVDYGPDPTNVIQTEDDRESDVDWTPDDAESQRMKSPSTEPTHYLVKYIEDQKTQVRSRNFIKFDGKVIVSGVYEVERGSMGKAAEAVVLRAGTETGMETLQKYILKYPGCSLPTKRGRTSVRYPSTKKTKTTETMDTTNTTVTAPLLARLRSKIIQSGETKTKSTPERKPHIALAETLKTRLGPTDTPTTQAENHTSRTETATMQPETHTTLAETLKTRLGPTDTPTTQAENHTSRTETATMQPETRTKRHETRTKQHETHITGPDTRTTRPETCTTRPETCTPRPETLTTRAETHIAPVEIDTTPVDTHNAPAETYSAPAMPAEIQTVKTKAQTSPSHAAPMKRILISVPIETHTSPRGKVLISTSAETQTEPMRTDLVSVTTQTSSEQTILHSSPYVESVKNSEDNHHNTCKCKCETETEKKIDTLMKKVDAIIRTQIEMKNMVALLLQRSNMVTVPTAQLVTSTVTSSQNSVTLDPVPTAQLVTSSVTSSQTNVTPEITSSYPFTDIPEMHRLPLDLLEQEKQAAFTPGHFACKIVTHLFPELFGDDNLRTQYSYHGGGRLNKNELARNKKDYLQKYVLYYYPDMKDNLVYRSMVITRVNELLRRPAPTGRQ